MSKRQLGWHPKPKAGYVLYKPGERKFLVRLKDDPKLVYLRTAWYKRVLEKEYLWIPKEFT